MTRRLKAAFAVPLVGAVAVAIGVSLSPDTTVASSAAQTVPTPESVFGFAPCTDYKLANYTQISSYFQKLDNTSDRLKLINAGKTSEGRDQIMAIVSAPENLTPGNLEKYRGIADRLAHARGLTDDQARQLASQGKAVAWIDFGIHATEVGPPQTAPQFAYDLVTSDSAEAKSIRKNVITLFVPNVNPDGGESVPDWYMKYVGTQYQDSSYPELYQKYAGHDDNRDWFMFNLPETKNLGNVLWHQWYPQLVYNTHQTAAYPARIFLPPFKDPMNPNIPPEVARGINLLGDAMTQRLDREGKTGAVSRQQYDQWWNGGLRSAPAFHNQVGILSETSHASATPVFEDPAKFPKTFPYQGVSTSEPSAFYPSPYKGGWWHLSDSCGYIESTGWEYLHTADTDRENWLYGAYRMGKQAIDAGGDNAYIIPSDQADFATATKMVNVLRQADVEVEQAQSAFTAGGKTYPAGSFIVREAQPFRADVVDLMNPQTYPDRRNPDGSPEAPYDMAGWTLPYQMGVKVEKVEKSFLVNAKPVDTAAVPAFRMPATTPGYAYALDPRVNDSYTAAMQLLKAGETVTRTTSAVQTDQGTWPAGTFLVGVRAGADTRIKAQAKQLGLTVAAVASAPANAVSVGAPRIGLYHGWGGNSDEGWTRYVLEGFKFPYTQVHDDQVRAGALRDSYDVIVLPDASYNSMLRGLAAGSHPATYTGGMTQAGVDNLKAFVQAGGTLVTVNDAAQLPIRGFSGFPITDVTANVPSTSYYSPGSILATDVDTGTPLTWGLPDKLDAYSDGSPAFSVNAGASGVTTPVTYPASNILRSGWLLGESLIAGKTAVADVKYGAGQVALLGISVQHRAEAHGTYKLLFNSLFLGAEK
ncbi:M14 family metallopeptidase [Candidatus Solirubrobacter pratensis]|uniref:M14 family metallopeptidase n=1 Tax=Candidatus Solirubrobacter pratensis TaxID=1298857 RepID=UPI000411869F|nr:M14 metallopeptidase family protein [Candidatus Solirubrobacter pratensis]